MDAISQGAVGKPQCIMTRVEENVTRQYVTGSRDLCYEEIFLFECENL
jgi:hypothetical protein